MTDDPDKPQSPWKLNSSRVVLLILGLVAALVLNRGLIGFKLFGVLVLLPWFLPNVVAGHMWALMLDPRLGVINDILVNLGILEQYKAWFADPNTALAAAMMVEIWHGFPFFSPAFKKDRHFTIHAGHLSDKGGIGKVLALILLYEIHDIGRFPAVGQFLSYARLVRCTHESAGKKQGTGGNKIGNAHLKWAFSEAACLLLRESEQAKK